MALVLYPCTPEIEQRRAPKELSGALGSELPGGLPGMCQEIHFRYLSKSGKSNSFTSGLSKSGLVITRALRSMRLAGVIPCR